MCGIIGIISENAAQNIELCNNKMGHRGPDDKGVFIDGNVAFGHQRLSIIDLSTNGHQPMLSADERYIIVFNGEIYNHLEIRFGLKDKYVFKSNSDTETILYGYIEYGPGLFNKLNGIFSFSIYDKETKELVIVRDQFGIKPLYYYVLDNNFLYSSELKAINSFHSINRDIDYSALVNYLFFLYSPADKTPFQNIKKLEAGHYISINTNDLSTFKIHKYYEIPFAAKYSTKTEAELIKELQERLYRAVERQLLSDVPIGFFLSGGLDSSAVVAMARKARPNEKLVCYTIDTGGEKLGKEGFTDDLHYAKIVAKHLDVDLKIVSAKVDIIKDFDKMIYHLDEPQADAAPLNVLNICKQARKDNIVVLLGGTAGDDLFSGYRRHQTIYYEKYLNKLPGSIKKLVVKLLAKFNGNNATIRRLRKLFNNSNEPNLKRRMGLYAWLSVEDIRPLFNDNIRQKISNYEPTTVFKEALDKIPLENSSLNQMLFWDMKYFLTDHNLNYTDKLSMAVGVETRVPFLDKELVEFSTLIPPELKMKGKTVKYLLKKAMEDYLPHEVIYRPKAGFGAPVREWITNDMKHMIENYLSTEQINKRGIFNPTKVHNLITDNKSGKTDASYSIWCLLAIESWFRQFADS